MKTKEKKISAKIRDQRPEQLVYIDESGMDILRRLWLWMYGNWEKDITI